MTPQKRRFANTLFALLLIVYAFYGAAFIWNSSGEIGGTRTFMLFDDAMISMRYAKNLAAGYGLVWNPGGERVEGYTNPLWVLYMALFHWLGVNRSLISLCIQISALIFLLLNLLFVRRIADLLNEDAPLVGVLAAFFTAAYLPLNTWALLGMEVSILTLLISVVVWLLLKQLQSQSISISISISTSPSTSFGSFRLLPYLLLGVGTLIRFDVAVPFVVTILFMALADRPQRSRHLLIGGAILIAFLGAQTLFRLAYYGDPLPNTYYLKVEGFPVVSRIAYGLLSFFNYANGMNWLIYLIPFSLLLFRRERTVLLLFAFYGGQAAYSIYVGGDAWDWWGGANRFICLAMPLFFVLLASGLVQLYAAVRQHIRNVRSTGLNRRLLNFGAMGIVALMTVNLNAMDGGKALAEWTLQKPALHVLDSYRLADSAAYLSGITTPEATVAVVEAGVLPYFLDRTCIDLLGKSDRWIAHLPMHTEYGWYPGHLKWDAARSIGQLRPDVIATGASGVVWLQIQRSNGGEDYLADYQQIDIDGHTYYFRKESPNIRWELLPNSA